MFGKVRQKYITATIRSPQLSVVFESCWEQMEAKAETTSFKREFQRKKKKGGNKGRKGKMIQSSGEMLDKLPSSGAFVSSYLGGWPIKYACIKNLTAPPNWASTHMRSAVLWKVTLWDCASVSAISCTGSVVIIIRWYLLSTQEEESVKILSSISYSNSP